jgi:hypothetical protein
MSSELKIEYLSVLNGTDQWAKWSHQMESYLMMAGCDNVLMDSPPATTDEVAYTAWKVKNGHAAGAILYCVSPDIGSKIMWKEEASPRHKRYAKELWDNLETRYGRADTVLTWTQFEQIMFQPCFDSSKSIQQQADKFSAAMQRVVDGGLKLEANMQALLFMSKLPESYRSMVTGLLMHMDLKDLKVNLVLSKAVAWENMSKSGAANPSNQSAQRVSTTKPAGKGPCSFCKKDNHDESHCWKAHPEKKPKCNRGKEKNNSGGGSSLLSNAQGSKPSTSGHAHTANAMVSLSTLSAPLGLVSQPVASSSTSVIGHLATLAVSSSNSSNVRVVKGKKC